ncbi:MULTISPECIES: restriction endonuclease subunit S [Microbacterium]|uniref:restriction endonuclease subunit S n=1 Tax=Microbacterium TaxID=33882 RepID=UPI0012FEE573|nr:MULTISPECIES: restriction endonuclease subunit S [Microbacterium]
MIRSTLAGKVELHRGQSYKSALLDEPGPYLLGLGTIARNGGFSEGSLRTYGGESPDRILLRPGDLYLSLKDVTHKAELLGAVARVPADVPLGRLTQDTVRLQVTSPEVDADYLYWLLRSPDYRAYCRMRGTGTTNLDLSRADFLGYEFLLPAVPEQQAIAEVLGVLDDKIAANTALAANTEQVLRAEIDVAWLRREDRSSTLAEFVELNPKVSVPRSKSAVYVDMKRLPESGWSIDGYDHREPRGGARFRNGDTLLARITPCLENRKTGFVNHLEDDEVGIGSTEFIVMRTRHGIAAPVSFLLATEARFREFAIQHMIGTSGRQRVAASDLAAFELPTPDFAWLDQFGRRVDALFAAVAAQARENRTLAATRDALLPQLMSGKLRVRDAEQAVAAAGV